MGSMFSSASSKAQSAVPASTTDQIQPLFWTHDLHRLLSQTCRTAYITIYPTLGSCTSWPNFAAAIFQRAASGTYATYICRQTPGPKLDLHVDFLERLKRYPNKGSRTSASTQLDLDRLRSSCCAPARACPIASLAESYILYRVSDVSST